MEKLIDSALNNIGYFKKTTHFCSSYKIEIGRVMCKLYRNAEGEEIAVDTKNGKVYQITSLDKFLGLEETDV